MNKKGMELSVNFMVMLILSIVVFGFGIYLVGKIFSTAELEQGRVSDNVKAEVRNRLFRGGDAVAIPWNKEKLKIGESHTFGLGILNTYTEVKNFKIEMTYVEAYDRMGKMLPQDLLADQGYINSHWIFTEYPVEELKPNTHAIIPLSVLVDNMIGDTGTRSNYIYKFNVCVSDVSKNVQINCANPSREAVRKLHGSQVLTLLVEVV
ncbi:MAG: hypothetical protein ACE5FT_05215 [Candidatus Nanoarchaeia archaeon]